MAFNGASAGVPDGVKISAVATQVIGGVQNLYLSFDTTFQIGATRFRPADIARWNGSALTLALPTEASFAVPYWNVTGASLRPDLSWQLAFDVGSQMPFTGGIRFFTSDVLRATPTVNAYELRLRTRSLDWEGAKIAAWDALDYGLAHLSSFSVIVNHNTNPVTLAVKRSGAHLSVDTIDPAIVSNALEFLALEEALDRLAGQSERLAQVVELHFYAGLNFKQIGQALALSERTIKRDWRLSRAYLYQQLRNSD